MDNLYSYKEFRDLEKLVTIKKETGDTIAVVVPTLNEANNVRTVLSYIKEKLQNDIALVDELLVLDGGSTDDTCGIASGYTELVFDAREGIGGNEWSNGKGLALWRAQFLTDCSIITYVDADIENFDDRFVAAVVGPLLIDRSLGFSKSFYKRPFKNGEVKQETGGGRVTEILVRPFISRFFSDAVGLIQPLSGEYALRRGFIEKLLFYTGYGVETSLVLDFIRKFGFKKLGQVDLGERIHRNRPLSDLGKMAFVILQTLMDFADSEKRLTMHSDPQSIYWGLVDGRPVGDSSGRQEALPLGCEVEE